MTPEQEQALFCELEEIRGLLDAILDLLTREQREKIRDLIDKLRPPKGGAR
jgi:hypothetical protein